MTLSVGKSSRSHARAIYADPELLIIDDALAAVDGKVANRIFQRVCTKRNPRATIIMALNQLNFLPRFDHIVMMEAEDQGGTLLDQGTFDELMERCQSFRTWWHRGLRVKSLDDIEKKRLLRS